MLNKVFIGMLQATRSLRRAVLGPAWCRYPVACTDFAIAQLHKYSLPKACWRILLRLATCNPVCRPCKNLEE